MDALEDGPLVNTKKSVALWVTCYKLSITIVRVS